MHGGLPITRYGICSRILANTSFLVRCLEEVPAPAVDVAVQVERQPPPQRQAVAHELGHARDGEQLGYLGLALERSNPVDQQELVQAGGAPELLPLHVRGQEVDHRLNAVWLGDCLSGRRAAVAHVVPVVLRRIVSGPRPRARRWVAKGLAGMARIRSLWLGGELLPPLCAGKARVSGLPHCLLKAPPALRAVGDATPVAAFSHDPAPPAIRPR